jgi:hypothetical protein
MSLAIFDKRFFRLIVKIRLKLSENFFYFAQNVDS